MRGEEEGLYARETEQRGLEKRRMEMGKIRLGDVFFFYFLNQGGFSIGMLNSLKQCI